MAFQLPPKFGTVPSSFSLKTPNTLNKMFDAISSGINTDGSGYYTAADPNDNRMFMSGHNGGGILGPAFGERNPYPSCSLCFIQVPGNNWAGVTLGDNFAGATKSDGTAWAWGYGSQGNWQWNAGGMLGYGGDQPMSSPTQIPGNSWARLFATSRSMFGLKCDGTLWGWGSNAAGQLGFGCRVKCERYYSPTQIPGNNWKMVSGNVHSSIGIKCDGTAWTWGNNGHGQLGICCVCCPYPGTCCIPACFCPSSWACNNGWVPCFSTITDCCPYFSSPTQLPGNNWICGLVSGGHQMAALKSDGTVWTWGHNPHGQLGTNDTVERICPVQIGGSSWIDIAGGNSNVRLRKNDNSHWGFGYNPHGELGDGTTTSYSSPIQILGGGTNWVKMSCSTNSHHAGGIKSDGTLWTWGYNPYGELGKGITGSCCCPFQVGAATSTYWKDITTSHHQSLALACVPANYNL